MRVGRKTLIALLCVLVVLAAGRVGYAYHRFNSVARTFDLVKEGDSNELVLSTLGKPNYHSGDCRKDLQIAGDCASELIYSYPLAPWVPEYYVVDFSPQGKVIAHGHSISP
jgi:hypothetical protein